MPVSAVHCKARHNRTPAASDGRARGPHCLSSRLVPAQLPLTNHTVVDRAPGSRDYQFVRRPVVNQIWEHS